MFTQKKENTLTWIHISVYHIDIDNFDCDDAIQYALRKYDSEATKYWLKQTKQNCKVQDIEFRKSCKT